MTVYSFLSFASFIIMFFLANYVYFEDRKNLLNRVFALFCFLEAGISFLEFMVRQAQTSDIALYWLKAQSFWPFVIGLLLHFTLLFTNSKFLKYKLTYLGIYFPALFFSIVYFYNVNLNIPVKMYLGYITAGVHKNGFIYMILIFWSVLLAVASSIYIFHFYLQLKEIRLKRQAKSVLYAFLVLIFASMISMVLPNFLKIKVPDITNISMVIFALIIFHAIITNKLFALTPSVAADKIISTMTDMFILANPSGNIILANPAVLNILGYEKNELEGSPVSILFAEESFKNIYWDKISIGETVDNHELKLKTKNGNSIRVRFSSSIVKDDERNTAGIICIARDITETFKMAKKMNYQATHDSLTGLTNRNRFKEQLEMLIVNAKDWNAQHAFLYLDLDEFKIVNDTCGHFAGDQLLRQLSFLIKQKIRYTDLIARLGGDEFGVLLRNCSITRAVEVAEKLCVMIRAYRFTWEGKSFSLGVSIGVVSIDRNSESVDKVLSAADNVCYLAKEKGGNRIYIYQADDFELVKRHGEMQYIPSITKAFEEQRFCLYYQPIIPLDPKNNLEHSFEILLRMLDESGNLIPPMMFLPAAQRYNLMPAIDRWVITTFFNFYRQHHAATPDDKLQSKILTCNINLTGASLNDELFLQFIYDRFEEYKVPPEIICFEITETEAIDNFATAIEFIHKFKAMGCRFSLDDFGSGLSSFNYLKHLPVDYLKIDGMFVKNMVETPLDCAMVRTINEIGHLMGIKTIAEFVENEAIFEKLRDIGVDYAQGYWIARPFPLEEKLLKA